MGISGLIPFLEKASSTTNIKNMKGSTVAIDTYCWLHKGAFACADKLARGEETDIYVRYCFKYINLLLSYNIKPILVFDGMHLPAKKLTEQRRRESRKLAKEKAAELMRQGRVEEGRSYMRRCIDITHDMALQLMQECRKKNVDCIVAPYEADAQLAYLNKINIAQYVITEDSDLVLFGCKKILFKLDLTGNCLLVESEKLHLTMGCPLAKYTFEKFRCMCILSGCDYLDSLHGVGLAKACKFFMLTDETDLTKALKKVPQYLNLKNVTVSDDYIVNFLMAEATFNYMFVYDPFLRKMVRLNNLPENSKSFENICSNAGTFLDDDIAFNLAVGNLNPFTLKKVDNWIPENEKNLKLQLKSNSKQINKTKHKSIWEPNYETHVNKKEIQKNIGAFLSKKISRSVKMDRDNEDTSTNEETLLSFYTPPTKKQCLDSDQFNDEVAVDSDKNKHNPFVKSAQISSTLSTKNSMLNTEISKCNISKFKRTVIDDKKEIRSRFFTNSLVKNNFEIAFKDGTDLDTFTTENDIFYENKNTTPTCSQKTESDYYELDNPSSPLQIFSDSENAVSIIGNNDSEKELHEVIEIFDVETEPSMNKTLKTRKNVKVPGLKKKASLQNINTIQTRLSAFGFKKKSSLEN